jgi:ABC-type Zn uptake system ZnuABC Zn-binding protein ZnuA
MPSDVRRKVETSVSGIWTGLAALLVTVLLTPAVAAQGAINVVTTTEDLASLTREIGGEAVRVEAIARGYQDPHFVELKPSYILKLVRDSKR